MRKELNKIVKSERGVALTLVMIVLVIVAIAGVSSIRDSYLNIKASSYFEDSKLSDDSASRILDSHFKIYGSYDFLAKPGDKEGSAEEEEKSNFYRSYGALVSTDDYKFCNSSRLKVNFVGEFADTDKDFTNLSSTRVGGAGDLGGKAGAGFYNRLYQVHGIGRLHLKKDCDLGNASATHQSERVSESVRGSLIRVRSK